MNYAETMAFLEEQLEVDKSQVESSFIQATVFCDFPFWKAHFTLAADDPRLFINLCGGKIPLKIFHARARTGRLARLVTIYSFSYLHNGLERFGVTTSPFKRQRSPKWRGFFRTKRGQGYRGPIVAQ